MLDGAARVKPLIEAAVEQGMPAVAVTDHGNVFGAFDFWRTATEAGIKPIIGTEAYITPGHPPRRQDPGALGQRRRGRRVGRRRLHAHDAAVGDHRGHAQPVPALAQGVDRGLLLQAAHGPRAPRPSTAPASSPRPAASSGEVQTRLRLGQYDEAVKAAGDFRDIFGKENYFAEIMDHGLDDRAPHHERPAEARQGARPAARRHERPALHARPRRHQPRRPALRAVRLDARRPEPVQVRRRRVLPEERRPDAAAVPRLPRGLRQHAAHRRALRRRVRHQRQLHAALPGARGRDRGHLVHQGGRGRPRRALPERHPRRGAQAGRLRGRRHPADGLPRLLPRRRRLHQLVEAQRHPRRPRPWFRRRLDGGLRHEDHRPRPAAPRADLRAVPQPRPRLHARLRRRLRRSSPRRGHQVRHREVRRRARRPDRHLRHHQGQAGAQGLLARARLPVRHGRQAHQGDAAARHGQGHPAHRHLRQGRTRATRRPSTSAPSSRRIPRPGPSSTRRSASRTSSASGVCTPPA